MCLCDKFLSLTTLMNVILLSALAIKYFPAVTLKETNFINPDIPLNVARI